MMKKKKKNSKCLIFRFWTWGVITDHCLPFRRSCTLLRNETSVCKPWLRIKLRTSRCRRSQKSSWKIRVMQTHLINSPNFKKKREPNSIKFSKKLKADCTSNTAINWKWSRNFSVSWRFINNNICYYYNSSSNNRTPKTKKIWATSNSASPTSISRSRTHKTKLPLSLLIKKFWIYKNIKSLQMISSTKQPPIITTKNQSIWTKMPMYKDN